jgi:hypothetical protein
LIAVKGDTSDDLLLHRKGKGEIRFQGGMRVHDHVCWSQLPLLDLKVDTAEIPWFFSQDREDPYHILCHLLGKSRRARFLFIEVESGTLFPENPKRRELKEVGEIVSCRFHNPFHLEACVDSIDD